MASVDAGRFFGPCRKLVPSGPRHGLALRVVWRWQAGLLVGFLALALPSGPLL